MFEQGSLTEGKGFSTVDLLVKITYFAKEKITFSVLKKVDLY
jgi:hypothetical protein